MRKINNTWIHIGPHKTGSTTIQIQAAKYKAELEDLGVLYPGASWHAQLASYFSKTPLQFVYNRQERRRDLDTVRQEDIEYFDFLQTEIAKSTAGTVLLSYEGFWALDGDGIKGLASWACGISENTYILLYVREPTSFATSEISQHARMGFGKPHPKNLSLRYSDVVQRYLRFFDTSQFVVRPFLREAFPDSDIFLDILDVLGIESALLPGYTLLSENKSLSSEAIMTAWELSKMEQGCLTGRDFLLKYDQSLRAIGGPKFRLGTRLENHLIDVYEKNMRSLSDQLGIDIDSMPKPISNVEGDSFGDKLNEEKCRKLAADIKQRVEAGNY